MGQQQLLLLVMGVIIVGVAVMGGLFAVQDKMKQSEADNLISRSLEIGTAAVAWKTVKDPFNGGNASYSGLNTDGFKQLFMEAVTKQGTFSMTSPTSTTLEITGVSNRYPEIGVRAYVNDYDVDSTLVRYDGSITN